MTTSGLHLDEFLAGDWPDGAELVEGKVIVSDPTFRHQEMVIRLVYALRTWTLQRAGRGLVGVGGNWVLLPANTFKPDLWWVSEDHRPDPASARSDVAADLVVEVRSPGTWRYDIAPSAPPTSGPGRGSCGWSTPRHAPCWCPAGRRPRRRSSMSCSRWARARS